MTILACAEVPFFEISPIICVVGARPNFMKMAPVLRAMSAHFPPLPAVLVHTGQHYDRDMCDCLFEALHLPQPDINLEVGSGTHAVQTADIMRKFEPVLDAHKPSCIIVVGDVNSTLACTLVAAKKNIPAVHIEAGLRSHDRAMPEEINRVLTDQISDRLYYTERMAEENLRQEGILLDRVCFVGNVMIDSVMFGMANARCVKETLNTLHVDSTLVSGPLGYGVVTLHRPSNVDHPETLRALLEVLGEVSASIPLVFPVHPRTRSNIERFGLMPLIDPTRIVMLPAQGYLEMLGFLAGASLVLTDSGGLQEETTALGVPCLTLRDSTERPITVEQGTNTLVGRNRDAICGAVKEILLGKGKRGRIPELWDGHAAERIVADLYQWLHTKVAAMPSNTALQ
ncbi:MAG: UDP-N-acetylglucosamine 2-epimerase (non-hydrolyzing) [Rhodoferax sp.]|nr:UDP-N-acetylglucosamine 2-epimerase (non-hydrolyzing) [Rhodoferax sp.]MDP3652885.1 UDP-N-acetylglucosamine 2-epimerase (non-hydrolyzing) [Rhodoferax sp.]